MKKKVKIENWICRMFVCIMVTLTAFSFVGFLPQPLSDSLMLRLFVSVVTFIATYGFTKSFTEDSANYLDSSASVAKDATEEIAEQKKEPKPLDMNMWFRITAQNKLEQALTNASCEPDVKVLLLSFDGKITYDNGTEVDALSSGVPHDAEQLQTLCGLLEAEGLQTEITSRGISISWCE